MALIKCHECGKDVSTEAKKCPSCGAKVVIPKAPPKPTKKSTWVIGGLFAVAIVGAAVQSNQQTNSASDAKAAHLASLTPEQRAKEAEGTKKRDAQLQLAGVGLMDLKRAMKDPEAFELTKLIVKPNGAACYDYRAKNGFGAILPSSAILTPKGKLLTEDKNGNTFVDAWNKNCTPAGGDNITELVKRAGVI